MNFEERIDRRATQQYNLSYFCERNLKCDLKNFGR